METAFSKVNGIKGKKAERDRRGREQKRNEVCYVQTLHQKCSANMY